MQDSIFYNNMMNEVNAVNQEFQMRQDDSQFNTVLKPLVESFSEMGIMGAGGKLVGQGYSLIKNKIFNSVKDVAKQKLKEAGVDDETIAKLDADTPEKFIANAKKVLSDAITKTKQTAQDVLKQAKQTGEDAVDELQRTGTDALQKAQSEAETLLEQGKTAITDAQGQITGGLEQAQSEAGNLLGQAQQTTSNIIGQGDETGQGLLSQGQEALQSLRGRLPQAPEITQTDEPSFFSKLMSKFTSKPAPQPEQATGADEPIEMSPSDIGETLTGEARQQFLDVMSGRPTSATLLDDDTYETAFKQFQALKRIGVIKSEDSDFKIPDLATRPSTQTNTSSNIAKAFKDKQDEIKQSQQTEEQDLMTSQPDEVEMTTFKTTQTPIQEGEPTQTIAPETTDTIAPESQSVLTEQTPLTETITPDTSSTITPETPKTDITPEAEAGEDIGKETGEDIGKNLGEDVGEDLAETAGLDEIPVVGELALLGSAIAGIFEATKKRASPIALQASQQFL